MVGQVTGGNLRGINGGAFFFLNLPNSRLEIDLPLIGQFPTHIADPLLREDIASAACGDPARRLTTVSATPAVPSASKRQVYPVGGSTGLPSSA